MAVIPHDTKVLSLSPVAYWDFAEASGSLIDQGSSTTDLAPSGTPGYQQTSLLKDGSDFAARISTGSFAAGSGITTTGGYTISVIFKISTYPSGTMYPIQIGSGSSFDSYCWIGFWTGGGGLQGIRVTCGRSTGSGFTQDEVGSLVVGRTHHLVVAVTSTNIKVYLDGAPYLDSNAYTGILTLANENISIATGSGADYVIDELSIFDGALSTDNIIDLFKSVRAVDEDATQVYVAADGEAFGSGTELDPIDLYSSQTWPIPPGGEVICRGGRYELSAPVQFQQAGSAVSRIKIRSYAGELAQIVAMHSDGFLVALGAGSRYVDFIGQGFAAPDGSLTGFELLNERTQRFAWKGNYPEGEELTEGTVNGTSITTAAADVFFHGPTHEGLTLRILDGDNDILHETTIATVNGFKDIDMTDSFPGGSQALSVSLKVKVYGSAGYRYEGGGLWDFGQDNRFIGPYVHDVGDGMTSFVNAHRTKMYYGLYTNLGWCELYFRDHAHTQYWQNAAVNGYKETHGVMTFECGGSTGKFDSSSGYADNFIINRQITAGSGEHEDCVFFDLNPWFIASATMTAGTNTLTYTGATGTLSVGYRVRVKGAGWFGTDLFARVTAAGAGTATLSLNARTNVAGAEIASYGNFSKHQSGLFTGSANYSLPSYNHIITECINLKPHDGRYDNALTIGYSVDNVNAEITDNFTEGAMVVNRWGELILERNTIMDEWVSGTDWVICGITKRSDQISIDWAEYSIDENDYRAIGYPAFSGLVYPFLLSGTTDISGSPYLTWVDASNPTRDWQDTSGTGGKFVDPNGSFTTGYPTVNPAPFLHAQDPAVGLAGAANLVILNYEHLTSVDVDLTDAGLIDGQRFQIRDAELYREPYAVIYDDFYDEGSPAIAVPIYEVDTVADFASLPATGTFGINYQTLDNDNYYRWGTDGDYHQVLNPVPRTQPIGWTESEFSNLNPYKPERLMAKIIPYAEAAGPGQPTGVAASRVTNNRIDVVWTLGAGIHDSVILEYRLNGGAWQEETLGDSAESYSLTDGVTGGIYDFRIKGVNGFGSSVWSDTVTEYLTGVYHFGTAPVIE